jgi:hypothetical protein
LAMVMGLCLLVWGSPASTDTFTLRDTSFVYSILLKVGGTPVA